MKRYLFNILLILSISILSADICWDTCPQIGDSNKIFGTYATLTDVNNIFVSWTEVENSKQVIKLQKTDDSGAPIWQNPITITDTIMTYNKIFSSSNDRCFIFIDVDSNQRIYKIDSDGSILWEKNFPFCYKTKFIPLENGGLIRLYSDQNRENYSMLKGTYYNSQGEEIWDNTLYSDCSVLQSKFINNKLYILEKSANNAKLLRFSENGVLENTSESFPTKQILSSKFMNNQFYIFQKECIPAPATTEMWSIDLTGGSTTGNTPKIISNTYPYQYIFSGDDYFYGVCYSDYQVYHFAKFDYEGNFLSETDKASNGLIPWAFDGQKDFLFIPDSNNNYPHGQHIITIDESGPSDPIDFLPQGNIILNSQDAPKGFSTENRITICGIVLNTETQKQSIMTSSIADSTIEVSTLRDIRFSNIFDLKIAPRNNGVSAFWEDDKSKLRTQFYNENGEPQFDDAGEIINEHAEGISILDNILFSYGINVDQNSVTINKYNLDGNQLWNEPKTFSINGTVLKPAKIRYFENGYLFYSIVNSNDDSIKKAQFIYFDDNQQIWSTVLDLGNVDINSIHLEVRANEIIYQRFSSVYYRKLFANGTFGENNQIPELSSDMKIFGDSNKFMMKTLNLITNLNEFRYFNNGEIVWTAPLTTSSDFSIRNIFFDEDKLSLIGFNQQNQIQFLTYDYNKNPINENTFDFNPPNPVIPKLYSSKIGDDFVLFLKPIIDYQPKLTYSILDEVGNQTVPQSQPITDKEEIENYQVKFINQEAYELFSTLVKYIEGESFRTYFIQKIDLSDLVGNSNENAPDFSFNTFAYPNPFNPRTTISYTIPKESNVNITVYNIRGQKVKQLLDNKITSGKHFVIWNGKDSNNKSVSSGVYFYRLTINQKEASTKKMILLK